MISLADLTRPLTVEEVRTAIYNVIAAAGVNTTAWKPGAVVRTIIAAAAIILSSLSSLISAVASGGFLETASGSWLTLVARHVFGVERFTATFAPGEVTLTNAGGGTFNLNPEELIVSNPDTGKTYRNTEAFSLGALTSITIPIVAIEAGSESTSTAGTIVQLETVLLGVTVTNEDAVVGQDEEQDAALKQRCLEKLGSLSPNGPWDAYTYVARNARREDGTLIGINRVRTTNDGFGNVYVRLATATGAVTGDEDDPDTDLGAIAAEIQLKAVPLAVSAHVESAVPEEIDITYQAWMYNTTGRSEAEIKTEIELALATYLSSQPIGGNVISGSGGIYRSLLETQIAATFQPDTFRVVVTTPAADVVLSADQVPVLGTVTATITQVSTQGGI